MKKIILLTLVSALSVSLIGCTKGDIAEAEQAPQLEIEQSKESLEIVDQNKVEITKLIEEFGTKLQMVSLLSPEDILTKSMEENYGNYITQELLQKWISDPTNALGRLTSSPWPDRIEIIDIEELSELTYKVEGEVIEVTSAESDGVIKKPITILVTKNAERYLIDSVTFEQEENHTSIVYTNNDYGFNFKLPTSWDGYTIIDEKWEGRAIAGKQEGEIIDTGEIVIIRNPKWTEDNPHQDIPIMIFTNAQWELIENEEISLGAAPIGPRKLGENSNYVFALPARYNFSFPTGYEEVEEILDSNPLNVIK